MNDLMVVVGVYRAADDEVVFHEDTTLEGAIYDLSLIMSGVEPDKLFRVARHVEEIKKGGII